MTIKGQEIYSAAKAKKILGVLMDSELRYKQHVAKTGSKGLDTALASRILKGLSPATARRFFEVTMAPVVNCALSV